MAREHQQNAIQCLNVCVTKSKVTELDWMHYVTCNDISAIYVTAHRYAGGLKKKFDLQSGSQRHKHLVGFLNVPVQAPTRDHTFYGYSEKLLHFNRLLQHAWWYGQSILDLTPPPPTPTPKGKKSKKLFFTLR